MIPELKNVNPREKFGHELSLTFSILTGCLDPSLVPLLYVSSHSSSEQLIKWANFILILILRLFYRMFSLSRTTFPLFSMLLRSRVLLATVLFLRSHSISVRTLSVPLLWMVLRVLSVDRVLWTPVPPLLSLSAVELLAESST